jgi:DNA-binding transcriptional LysR family regulator
MRFDIIDLRLFLNVYKAGSITGGAALSHLTLQSASERIRGMESELGVPLFSRSRKGVKLSDAGYSLVNHANIVLQQVDHMRSELHQYGKGLRGHINLLCNSSAQSEFLPSLIGPYLLSNPNISISVKEMLSHDIVAAVKNQMANLGIVADSTQLNGLASLPFNDDELEVFAPAKGRLHDTESTTFEEIVTTEFIGFTRGWEFSGNKPQRAYIISTIPNATSVHEDVDVKPGNTLKSVPMKIPAINPHNLLIKLRNAGPMKSCHIFVTREGIINKLAALAGAITMVNNPMDIVGSPSPITPFTIPDNRNTDIMVIT